MSRWRSGIPVYTQDDIMSEAELLDFAMKIVNEYEIMKNDFELIAANNNIDAVPNFVVKKDNELCFFIVKAAIAPNMPTLDDLQKEQYKYHAAKFNAKCYFAPVGFGSTDVERFDAGLALREDDYYTNYIGLKEL